MKGSVKMKSNMLRAAFAAICAVLVAGASFAAPKEAGAKPKPQQPNPMAIAPQLVTKLSDEAVLKKIGVNQQDKRAKIAARAAALKKQFSENSKALRELNAGEAMKAAFEPGANIDAATEKIKKAGQLRTQREVLSLKALAMVNKTLNEKQRGKMREIVAGEFRQRAEARAKLDRKGPPKGPANAKIKAGKGPQKGPGRPKMASKGPRRGGGRPMMGKGPKGPRNGGARQMMKGRGPRMGGNRPMMGKGPKGPRNGVARQMMKGRGPRMGGDRPMMGRGRGPRMNGGRQMQGRGDRGGRRWRGGQNRARGKDFNADKK